MFKRKCFICVGKKFTEIVRREDGNKIMKCNVCGNIILNPAYDKNEILRMYSRENYFSNKNNQDKIISIGYGKDFHKYNLYAMQNKKSHFYQRLKIIQSFKKSGNIFEIGCAMAIF